MSEHINIGLVFAAGMLSVLSPCVLPVVPVVVTGTSDDHRFRPVVVVLGLALTFILMGVAASLFGSFIGAYMKYVEKAVGALIILFGLLLFFNVNLFKHMTLLGQLGGHSRGTLSGFFLGALLGIIWIPCVGPMLSGVLALVAARGKILTGVFYLAVYSIGFAVPLLLAGYASQFFRKRLRGIGKFPMIVNAATGVILVALGTFIITRGIVGIGF